MKKSKNKNQSFRQKVRNFFFPKNFKQEMYKGMYISSPYGCSAVLLNLGRIVRKIVDPRHKMFGQGKDNGTQK